MDPRPVFVLLTAKTCPACHNFKRKVWPSLEETLKKDGRVQIVEIEVPTTRSKPDPVKYHKDLARFIGWFPTMSLYPAERWYDHSSELIGIIKNGKIVPPGTNDEGNQVPEHAEPHGKINLTEEDTIKWVNYHLNDPDGMFVRLSRQSNNNNNPRNNYTNDKTMTTNNHNNNNPRNNYTDDKIMVTNNGRPIGRFPDGKFMVPTAGYYAKFEPSKVE